MIQKLKIESFKSLEKVEIELGQINIFVGANGSGKSNLLEALGVLSAAADGKVNDLVLLQRGVRPGVPKLYKSAFPAKNGGGILVITEGVFGMDGEQGKLKEIVALKQKYEFRILIDDAHGFGYMGPTGGGADEAQGCQSEIDLYFSTFVKSMGSIGAFISGNKNVLKYLRYNTRSQIFAKSLPLLIVEGMLHRMEMVKTMPELREKLWQNVYRLQDGLKARGFDIGNTNSPVTPVYMKGELPEATSMVMDLRENFHIFCSIVVYPVIPRGDIIFRIIPTAVHTNEDIDLTLKAFEETKKKLDSGAYRAEKIPDMAEAI